VSGQREQWPTDPEFRRFAARIADAVTRARFDGFTVSTGRETEWCLCPLGAVKVTEAGELGSANDYWSHNFRYPGYSDRQRFSFLAGFDGYTQSETLRDEYYRLGREYRRRALGEVKWGER
jgi:hypothetical protein